MLNLFRRGTQGFESVTPAQGWTPPEDAVWLDRRDEGAYFRGEFVEE